MKTLEANKMEPFEPTHPGEVIKDEIEYRGISQRALAAQIGVSYTQLNEVLNGKRTLNTELALLISAALDIDAEPLLAMQTRYDIITARRNQGFLSRLKSIRKIAAAELLRGMGVDFEILTKETPEDYPANLPLDEVPKYLSLQKSLAFTDEELPADFLLITSDTVVICESEILGKPKDREDAARMLQLLSGKTHHVVTGVTVRSKEKTESFAVRSNVAFAQLDAEEINYYIEHCKPFDKAGAYGIQEWIGYVGISGLEGSFYNVMGLPTRKLYQCLKSF